MTKTARLTKPEIPTLNLLRLSRGGMESGILLHGPGASHYWVKCGQIEVNPPSDRGVTNVSVRGPSGWTDPEHDSIKVLSFELIGVTYQGFWGGCLYVSGYFHPDARSFRVPTPEYLEALKASTSTCTQCKGADRHTMVDEGFYVPKEHPKEFERLREYRVEIQASLTRAI